MVRDFWNFFDSHNFVDLAFDFEIELLCQGWHKLFKPGQSHGEADLVIPFVGPATCRNHNLVAHNSSEVVFCNKGVGSLVAVVLLAMQNRLCVFNEN